MPSRHELATTFFAKVSGGECAIQAEEQEEDDNDEFVEDGDNSEEDDDDDEDCEEGEEEDEEDEEEQVGLGFDGHEEGFDNPNPNPKCDDDL